LHGIERRSASGEVHGANYQDTRLDGARGALAAFSAAHPGVHVEDKGRALAIHFRRAPGVEASIRREIDRAVGQLGDGFHIQEGSMVLEIKPRGPTKGTAIEAFLQEAPFWGRIPVFAGDDLTDQDGFRVIEAHRGISIAVGDKVPAQWRVEDPARLREWLRSFASLDGGAA
jgi:trehalose 6-phosphate phosphatase